MEIYKIQYLNFPQIISYFKSFIFQILFFYLSTSIMKNYFLNKQFYNLNFIVYKLKFIIIKKQDKIMNDKLKPLISLSEINSLPDGHLHSKVSFLKSIINEQQNPQILQMKQKVFKMSYTIKNIGIHGEEIGITSKRIPLKIKQKYAPLEENLSEKQKQMFRKKYLPHNSFYSQPLVAIKNNRTIHTDQQQQQNKDSFIVTSSMMRANDFFKQNQNSYLLNDTKFAKKISKSSQNDFNLSKKFSHGAPSRLKSVMIKQNNLKQKEFIQKMTTVTKSKSQSKINNFSKVNPNRKSFAKLLSQHNSYKKQFQILPLQHEENPLFKKIKKLQKITAQRTQTLNRRTQSLRGLSRHSTVFMGRYQAALNTARKIQSHTKYEKTE